DQPLEAAGVGSQPMHQYHQGAFARVVQVVKPDAVDLGEALHKGGPPQRVGCYPLTHCALTVIESECYSPPKHESSFNLDERGGGVLNEVCDAQTAARLVVPGDFWGLGAGRR